MLTQLQISKFAMQFRQLDADDSGQLEWNDFELLLERLRQSRGLAADSPRLAKAKECYLLMWEALKKHSDLDDGATISLGEWLAFHEYALHDSFESLFISTEYEQLVDVMTNFVQELLDSDGDGNVSLEEYEAFLKAFGVNSEQARSCFAGLDRNNDGVLTRMELLDLVLEYYRTDDPKAPGNQFFGILAEME